MTGEHEAIPSLEAAMESIAEAQPAEILEQLRLKPDVANKFALIFQTAMENHNE